MSDPFARLMSHVSAGTNRFDEAVAFYDAVLPTVGATKVLAFPGAAAYGKPGMGPEFWVQQPIDGASAAVGNGIHFGFVATSKEAVHAFYDAAMAAGATDDGPPGPREMYGPAYYGCFVRDLDGHKIEAMYWDAEAAGQQ